MAPSSTGVQRIREIDFLDDLLRKGGRPIPENLREEGERRGLYFFPHDLERLSAEFQVAATLGPDRYRWLPSAREPINPTEFFAGLNLEHDDGYRVLGRLIQAAATLGKWCGLPLSASERSYLLENNGVPSITINPEAILELKLRDAIGLRSWSTGDAIMPSQALISYIQDLSTQTQGSAFSLRQV
ncbi:MAG: hypothetical protein V1735_04945 [Nanoarchaeota archaeon]